MVGGAVFQEVPWSLKMGSRFLRDKRDMEEGFQGLWSDSLSRAEASVLAPCRQDTV